MYYKTSDLCLTAVLVCKGYNIESMEFETEKRAWFNFNDKPGLRNTIERFNNGRLMVEPKTFFTKLRDIKTRIYDEKNN